jgi:hypothetical protein
LQGNYRDLGLPEAWRELTDELTEWDGDGAFVLAPDHSVWIGRILGLLPERLQYVVAMRVVGRESLESIGTTLGLTRERIRQLEGKAARLLRRESEPFVEEVEAWIRQQQLGGHAIVRFPATPVVLGEFGPIDVVDAWRIIMSLTASADQRWKISAMKDGRWLLSDSSARSPAGIEAYVRSTNRFVPYQDVAAAVGLDAAFTLEFASSLPTVIRTNGGLLLSRHTTKIDLASACGELLVARGFDDWHFSELGALMRRVHPERIGDLGARDFASLLGRPGSPFVAFGTHGRWTLPGTTTRPGVGTEPMALGAAKAESVEIAATRMPPSPFSIAASTSASANDRPAVAGASVRTTAVQDGRAETSVESGSLEERILAFLGSSPDPVTANQIASAINEDSRHIRRCLLQSLEPAGSVGSDDGRRWAMIVRRDSH